MREIPYGEAKYNPALAQDLSCGFSAQAVGRAVGRNARRSWSLVAVWWERWTAAGARVWTRSRKRLLHAKEFYWKGEIKSCIPLLNTQNVRLVERLNQGLDGRQVRFKPNDVWHRQPKIWGGWQLRPGSFFNMRNEIPRTFSLVRWINWRWKKRQRMLPCWAVCWSATSALSRRKSCSSGYRKPCTNLLCKRSWTTFHFVVVI